MAADWKDDKMEYVAKLVEAAFKGATQGGAGMLVMSGMLQTILQQQQQQEQQRRPLSSSTSCSSSSEPDGNAEAEEERKGEGEEEEEEEGVKVKTTEIEGNGYMADAGDVAGSCKQQQEEGEKGTDHGKGEDGPGAIEHVDKSHKDA
eukprot:5142700-Prorocentrum_lima.AAC.1